MNKKAVIILISILLILSLSTLTSAAGKEYHLKLLAVQEDSNGKLSGSDADLYLELREEGSGRVFLDTYPLTKMDTQISTRFAKEMACKHFNLDCDKYDFIYTIKAKTSIIGGPSAGAAMAALTSIAVLDLNYDQSIAVTGTINSGGIVGQVGGVKEKLEAAANAGLKKVLIPQGSSRSLLNEETITAETTEPSQENDSFDLIGYGKNNLSLEVKEVMDLDEIIFELSGKDLNHKVIEITADSEYKEIMQGLQDLLCQRSERLMEEMVDEGVIINEQVLKEILDKKEKSENASLREDYYSSASFCFSANIQLKNYYYAEKSPDRIALVNLFNILEKKVDLLEKQLAEENIETISDLQSLMVVKERLADVRKQINDFNKNIDGSPKQLAELLAYAEERYFSALSWKQFFSMDGKKFVLDQQSLQNSCEQKIAEAEERYQYVELFLGPAPIVDVKEKINSAKAALNEQEDELCLITAAQAKGDANAIMSTLGLMEKDLDNLIASKIKAVELVISRNSAEGVFPILGYSYYQYANTLKETEKYTALIYLEYALEMSDLGIYFPEEQSFVKLVRSFNWNGKWVFLGFGFLIGAGIGVLIGLIVKRRKKGRKRKKLKNNRKKNVSNNN